MFPSARIFRRIRYGFWHRSFKIDAGITGKSRKESRPERQITSGRLILSEETIHTRRKISSTRSFSTGFCKKSHAPASIAFFKLLFVPVDESMTTRASG